jgi:transcriptional regulator with XRE-family HTH domain|tara:strand:- start:58 stop:501 length:444 start_codon:yes stop_codon:yes gene_type:complete
MDTERAGKILERHGLTKKAFADMMGVKASTARMAFSLKRFSKKMVAKLEELEEELNIQRDLAEVDEMIDEAQEKRVSIIEGVVRQSTGNALVQDAKVYGVPKNRFIRLIEFADGSHGKFRSKPGKYLKLGESVKVKHLDRDMWEVVR